MKQLGDDIVAANDSEIVLSESGFIKWLFRFFGLMLGFAACMGIQLSYEMSDYLSEALGGYCFSLFILAPLAVAVWQYPGQKTVIQFNQPMGYLTVKESPWWTAFIPAGPYFIKTPTQIALPKSMPFVEDKSGTITYPVRTSPDTVEIHQSHVNRFEIQIPLDDGKVNTLWTTDNRNTYVEIITRINKAIQEYNEIGN